MVLKAELHCHIEGTAHPELARRMAIQNGLSVAGLIDERGQYIWHDFTSFLAAYDRVAAMFMSEADYSELSYDYFMRAAAEGLIYGEVFISADHAAKTGLSYQTYVNALADGINRAHEKTGVVGRMIATCIRHLGPDRAIETARLLHEYPHPLVTGFGMAGDERTYRPVDFAPAFDTARQAGVGLTAHAGEFGGPGSVAAALDALHVKRIGHGVRAIEDPDLVARLVDEGIVLEVCPGSNIALDLYPDWGLHPLNALRAAGVRVTLNSDDPPFFTTTIGMEYDRAAMFFKMSEAELQSITLQALEAAFVDEETRTQLINQVDGT